MKTTFSRRELYALGEPLGNSSTYVKADGRLIFGDGGGGGGGGDTRTVQDLPEWAKPYAKETLGMTQGLTTTKDAEGNIIGPSKYQTRPGGTDMPGADPLQQQAYQGVGGMQIPGQTGEASNIAQEAAYRALNTQYQPGYFGNQFQAPGQYQPGQFGMMQAQAPELQQYQMGPAERASTQSFTQPGSAEAYMSPFMQNVIDKQTREAERQAGLAAQQQRAQSIQRGSFGGGRTGIREAAAARDLAQLKSDIYGTGQQAAFQNAQQQFNAEQQARMQAQLANQQAGLTVGGQNLAAQLGIQQLGAGQNLQAQLANQQAFQQAQAQREASRQFGYGQQMTAAQQRAQYGLAGQQLGEQSRQYGAGYGLQGLGTALQGSGQLGQLGQTQFGQQKDIYGLQSQFGAQQRAIDQERANQRYQDFLSEQRHPYQQLEFMSNILRGTPMGTVQTMYQAPPSGMQTLASLGLGAYGAKQLGMFGAKEGGQIKEYANGGSVTDESNVKRIVRRLSNEQLDQAEEAAKADGDLVQLRAIAEEKAMRASESRGMASAYNQLPTSAQAAMAGGGIVAFSGDEEDNNGSQMVSDGSAADVINAAMGQSYGDQNRYARSLDQLDSLINRMQTYQPEQLNPEQINKIIKDRFEVEKNLAGPAPYGDIKTFIAEAEANRPKALEQAKGLAALKAMSAIVQPGGFIRGLAGAGGAAGDVMDKAYQADRAEKRSLASMKFNMADAERKERMGMTRSAISAATQAQKDKLDAYKSHMQSLNYQAQAAARGAQAAKPTAQKMPSEPKLAEQLGAAEVAYAQNPTPENKIRVEGLRLAMDRAKTSDIGDTRLAAIMAGIAGQRSASELKAELAREAQDRLISESVLVARTKAQYSPEYIAAKTPEAKAAVLKRAEDEARAVFRPRGNVIKLD